MRCLDFFVRRIGICREFGKSHEAAVPNPNAQARGRTRLTVVCSPQDLARLRQDVCAGFRALGMEVLRVQATSLADERRFHLCFTIAYPRQRRHDLLEHAGGLLRDARVQDIRFGVMAERRPAPLKA